MGLFEKSRNITDTALRMVVEEGSEPVEALRRHILSLEESQRQLRSSQGFLERQRQWLEGSAERKLSLAEEWGRRAVTAAGQDRDDLARHALLRKKELLRSMSDDRRELERMLGRLREVEGRLGEIRRKIAKARSVRARFSEGSLDEVDLVMPEREESVSRDRDALSLNDREKRELDDELEDLKRRLKSGEDT